MTIRIGTSGWSYDHWEGVLYPPGMRPRDRLAHYTKSFDTVELNASYYRWPSGDAFTSWNERLPDGFELTVKAPRGLTHARKLREPERWIERISDSWHRLRDRRGVLLVQLPPTLARDDARLDYFLSCVPAWMRTAIEFRHPTWHTEPIFQLLAHHGAAYVVTSGAGLPCILRATAGFVYVRLHGPSHDQLYAGSYADDDMRWWAERVREWSALDLDVYAYFNNDGEGNAVRNAWALRAALDA